MSGYNKETGVFELTFSKANFWLRREPTPELLQKMEKSGIELPLTHTMEIAEALFKVFGFEITKIGSGYLHVKATPEQVWEVLSGQPSDPKRASHYYR